MPSVWENRERDDLYRMCESLISEKNRLRKLLEQVATACEAPPMTEIEEALAIVIREALRIDLSNPLKEIPDA